MTDLKMGVIWDVDGTLVDTAEQHFLAWAELSRQLGYRFSRDDFARTFGWRNPEIIRELYDPQSTDERCRELGIRKEQIYCDMVRSTGSALLPGVRELLDGFRSAGFLQAVGSSAPRGNLDLLLGVTGIAPYFDSIVSGDDVNRGKPDPEVFLRGASGLGIDPRRCIVFEDAIAGVRAAKAGGMACVAVTFVGHHPPEALLNAGADRVVGRLSEVTVSEVHSFLTSQPESPRKSVKPTHG